MARSLVRENFHGLIDAKKRQQAITALRDVAQRFGDLLDKRGRPYSELASACIFEMENLYVGATVPDIRGNDINDVPFALSDYRGKVVLLDFWGDW